jgi:UDPglucose--hexose-1-phosphate uridylyltransferase
MSEIRQNLATKEWVIIATERAKRPHDQIQEEKQAPPKPAYSPKCPFCPGNESQTPPATLVVGANHQWRQRVFPNKFCAVSPGATTTRTYEGPYRLMPGVGLHEVIVDTPRHDLSVATMSVEHVKELMHVYQRCFLRATETPKIAYTVVFKNHGVRAGTSLEHPHSQMVAVPLVPGFIRDRVEVAARYYDDHGECPYCKMLSWEIGERERIVFETKHFASFVLFAAYSPFHIWVMPKRHASTFADVRPEELDDLGICLHETVKRIFYGLKDPDFNYVVRSAPMEYRGSHYTHWYVSLMTRLSTPAGFELGSGMYINASIPEESAAFLRDAKIPG